jgi:hypothetical protein
MKILQSLAAVILLCGYQTAFGADMAKEQRLRNQVIDYILDGDAVMLKADGHEFLSIYMEAEEGTPKGGVILMHGRGLHPNWPNVMYPLRTGLPRHGWSSLSIQLPVLDNQSSFYDYLDILPQSYPRISAAVDYLRQQGIERIVLLAHSCGVHMSIGWLDNNPQQDIYAYIGVGMGSTDKGQPMLKPFALEKFKMPILDIRGEHDYPAVHGKAPDRWQRIQQAGHPASRQQVIDDADHYFTDRDDVLLKAVAAWLATLEP